MKPIAAFVLVVLAAPVCLHAQQVQVSNLTDDYPTQAVGSVQPGQSWAAAFTTDANSYTLSDITFDLYWIPTPSTDGTLDFSTTLYLSDGTGLPTGTALTDFSFDPLIPNSAPNTFTPTQTTTLDPDTEYVFVMTSGASTEGNVAVDLSQSMLTVIHPAGSDWTIRGYSAFLDPGSSTWSNYPGFYNYRFSVSTAVVPEPSAFAGLAGVLVLGFAAWRRQRRRLAASL